MFLKWLLRLDHGLCARVYTANLLFEAVLLDIDGVTADTRRRLNLITEKWKDCFVIQTRQLHIIDETYI